MGDLTSHKIVIPYPLKTSIDICERDMTEHLQTEGKKAIDCPWYFSQLLNFEKSRISLQGN